MVAGSSPAGGATCSAYEPVHSDLINFGFWMRRQGYRESTTRYAIQSLKALAKQVNLLDEEAVKEHLAKATFSEGRKERLSNDILRFYKFKGLRFQKPRYRKIEKLPFIPLESEIDQLISGMNKKTACFLQLLKECGLRSGEAWAMKWSDIDYERSLVHVTPEKNSKPRQLKISHRLIAMFNNLPRTSSYLFHEDKADPITSLLYFRRGFEKRRKKLATTLQNPRLLQIHFHTFRHFFATMTYHRTKDILFTMQQLGHKNIKHTLTYTQLVNFESDDYVCKVARTVDEAKALIEGGFDYVTDVNDVKLFRKRK